MKNIKTFGVSNKQPKDTIRADFLSALARLMEGKPTHPDLVVLANQGTLRLTISSVAKEARRSRTLIGTVDTPYSDIRQAIMGANGKAVRVATKKSEIENLRQRVKELEEQLRIMASIHAAYAIRLDWMESRQQRNETLSGESKITSLTAKRGDGPY